MMRLFCALLFLFLPLNSFAQNLNQFATLPILHEGRVKPLESFARVKLWQISGAETWGKQTATQWLANTVFTPETMLNKKFFAIKNQSQRLQLGLDPTQKFASFSMLHTYFQKNQPPKNDKDWQTLYQHYLDYSALLSSLTLVLPLPFEPQKSYLDVQKYYTEKMAMLLKNKGTELKDYNFNQKQLAASAWQLNALKKSGVTSFLFQVVPHGAVYLSPWSWHIENPDQKTALQPWQQAAFAYRNQDIQKFDTAIQKLQSPNTWRLHLEVFYQTYKPMVWAEGFYILGLILFLISCYYKRFFHRRYVLGVIILGTLCHASALLYRTLILQRPPSGTLYETLLFVSFITVLTGLLYQRQKTLTPMLIGAGLAALQLFVAPVFKPQGDSLEVLQAVLNTNFWLTIHVLIITGGYAISVLAASLAHAALYKKSWINFADVYKLLILALFLTAFGTMLGGIWADQSWGRFWGWDPKENGALLLALWLTWLLHGRVSGHLQPHGLLAFAACTNIIVALSWFGVNLLNVGLHSYGFTQGVAGGLAAFCVFESILIIWLWWRGKKFAT